MLPVFISSVILGVYQFRESKMEVENVMTGMYIFNLLRNAFRNLPIVLEQVANTFVSFKRIQEFLNLDEVNKSNITENEIDASCWYNENFNNKNNINENSNISIDLSIQDNSYLHIKAPPVDFLKNDHA